MYIYNIAFKNKGNLVIDLIEIKTDFTLSLIYYLSEMFQSVSLHSTTQNLNLLIVLQTIILYVNYKDKKPDK